MKRLYVKIKKKELSVREAQFSPLPRPAGMGCPYDEEFGKALDLYHTDPSEEHRQEVMRAVNQALDSGYSIRDYLERIKELCYPQNNS